MHSLQQFDTGAVLRRRGSRYHLRMIYYVEDDANIRDLAIYTLRQSGFDALGFPDGDSFFRACSDRAPQAVLLDIMLPGKDGMQILEEVRRDPVLAHVPVMMLTAKGSEIDKVTGLDAGADDYLAKPFGMMEMVSRVKALLRRAHQGGPSDAAVLRCGGVALDPEAHKVSAGGNPVVLTFKEFALLQELMRNRGHVLTRAQLLESVWGWDFAGNTRTVDVHVQTLRQKLGEACAECGSLIETVRGVGYMVEA